MPEPRKPAELRAVESGNRVRARFKDDGVEPDAGGIGRPPAYLNADQRAAWTELKRMLAPGVLQKSDAVRFEHLAVVIATERRLLAEWNAAGCAVLLPPKRAGTRPALCPIYLALRTTRKDLRAILSEFGMSPVDRNKVKVPKAAAVNPLDKFLRPV